MCANPAHAWMEELVYQMDTALSAHAPQVSLSTKIEIISSLSFI